MLDRRIARPLFFVLHFIFILFIAAYLPAAHADTAYGQRLKVISPGGYRGLLTKFEDGSWAKVIVKVAAASPSESLLQPGETEEHAVRRRGAQDQVLADLEARGHKPTHVYRYKYTPYIAMTIDGNSLEALLQSPQVIVVEEDVLVPLALDLTVPRIGARALHTVDITGKGYAVAVLDTGVDKTHPFLQGGVVSEACYSSKSGGTSSLCPGGDEESTAEGSGLPCGGKWVSEDCDHGTHVAGIVAGRMGVPTSPGPGVAPEASIIAVQVFSRSGSSLGAWNSDIKKGLERVYELSHTYSIASVNMSLGEGAYTGYCDSYSLKESIDRLREAGIATVVASGNNGYCGAISAPACISSAVSVGATDDADAAAGYSNRAWFMSLFAPGSSIQSSVPGGIYQSWNGTSMAAPHVAGAWALMKEAYPAASVADILSAFSSTGSDIPVGTCHPGTTRKRMDVEAAHDLLSPNASLVVSKEGLGEGTVVSSPAGINCGADCGELFLKGTPVTLSAFPEEGTVFGGWSGGGCSGTDPCSVIMSQRTSVTALFVKETTIGTTLTISGVDFGTRKGKVLIGTTPAKISQENWNDDAITFTIGKVPEGSPDIFPVTVIPKSKGTTPIPPMRNALVVKKPVTDNPLYHGAEKTSVTITGKFFGTRKPKVFVEYTDREGLLKKKSCKVTSWSMDTTTGESRLTFLMPTLPKGSGPNTHLLEIVNKVGAATTSIIAF